MNREMIMKRSVKRLFPMINGIFTYINYQFPEFLHITQAELDIYFIANWGMRTVAPIVRVVHEADTEQLTTAELTVLGDMIRHMFEYKWDKQSVLLSVEYDPIHNYLDEYHEELGEDIEESTTRTPNITIANTETVDNDTTISDGGSQVTNTSGTTTSTRTDNLQESTTSTGENNLFGFNSDEAVGADTDASNTTVTNTGTVGNSESSNSQTTVNGGLTHTTDGTIATTGSKRTTGTESNETTSDRNRVRDFSHQGNIGNLTTQQLMNQEIELWRWNFIQEVLNDVKGFLTLPVYE